MLSTMAYFSVMPITILRRMMNAVTPRFAHKRKCSMNDAIATSPDWSGGQRFPSSTRMWREPPVPVAVQSGEGGHRLRNARARKVRFVPFTRARDALRTCLRLGTHLRGIHALRSTRCIYIYNACGVESAAT